MNRQVFISIMCIIISLCASTVQADVFNMGPGLTSLETVTVGNPGNVGELSGGGYNNGPARNCGAVSYTYKIGKYEVTAGQYTEFLNAVAKGSDGGLYSGYMADYSFEMGCNIQRTGSLGNYAYGVPADWANRPVNFVNWYDAIRFANWLTNGQPTGAQNASTTEDGAYAITTATGTGAQMRKVAAKWVIPTEDEWYKAAYYKGGSTNAGYWQYPSQSYTAPSNVGSDGYVDPGNHANYYANPRYTINSPYFRTNVGEFEHSASAYGTFDQGGNVLEWNEATFIYGKDTYRGLRGGSFYNDSSLLQAIMRTGFLQSYEGCVSGFRIAEVIPGDINNDGQVNDADYTVWANYFGMIPPANYRTGSGAYGGYNDADYTTWADNFGKSIATIPEPATLGLPLLGGLPLIRRRWRGSTHN